MYKARLKMKTKVVEILEGQKAPDFDLKNQNDEIVSLSQYNGKFIVLYFYPKDDTPGCTKEACSFRDHSDVLKKAGVVVLGVSLDDSESHRKFSQKFNLNFPLLCDQDAKVSRLYGVYKRKNLYARLYWGIERSTFIIDPKGVILKAFRKVSVDGHTEKVLGVINEASANAPQ